MMKFRNKRSNNKNDTFRLDEEALESIENEFPDEEAYVELTSKPKKRLRRFIIILSLLCILIIFINIGILLFTGKIWFNQPDKDEYPIRGAVVDSDMGEMHWEVFSRQNLSAAYIRATKGTSFVDECFEENWEKSKDCELLTGAYHVLSLNISGQKQAEYFCDTVGSSLKGRLIPAVEVELTGIYAAAPPDKEKTVKRLEDFLSFVEEQYGVKPLIICSSRSYKKYISGEFDEHPLWITDVYSEPDDEIDWDFWCYNNRVRVKGYENSNEYFSMFVYKDNVDTETFKKEYICK